MLKLLALDNKLRQVSVAEDPLDLAIILILFLELIVVVELFLLSGEKRLERVAGMGFPDTDVGVLGT
jgi:hypothetical protein